jgi:hypothetical protein
LIDLSDRSFEVKQAAVDVIAVGGDPRAATLLEALLGGNLYARESDRRPVLVAPAPGGYRLTDALDGSDLGEVERGAVKKITINNRMRNQLRTAIAALTLASPDPEIRLKAAQQMLGDANPIVVEAIREQLGREDDQRVRDYLDLSLALASLRDEAPAARLVAVNALSGSLYPAARNALTTLLSEEPDPEVRAAAERSLAAIEQKLKLNAAAETLFFGLSLGSVLVLAAIGLAITFGVMGVINMAHGELIMIGAYTTYLVQQAMPGFLEYSLFVAIPAAFLVAGLLGILIERTVIRFLYGRPLETLLATFGISLILQQLVRTTISAQNVAVQNPSWMSGCASDQPGARPDLQPALHPDLRLDGLRGPAADPQAHRLGAAGARGRPEPGDGALHGGALGAGRCAHLRSGCRCGGGGRCRPVPAHQRRPQHGAGLHHRLLHGRGLRRGREPLGDPGRRPDPGRGQQADGALGRRGTRQDPGAGLHHPLHPEAPARPLPAARTRGGCGRVSRK